MDPRYILCSVIAVVVLVLVAYIIVRRARYGSDFSIVKVSLLELIVLQQTRGEDARKGTRATGKPTGRALFSYGGLMDEVFRVYANGIQGRFGELDRRRMALGGLHKDDYVTVETRTAFVPFDRMDGIYPLEYSYETPAGGLHTKMGVQVETVDHCTLVVTFEKDPMPTLQQFRASLGRYDSALFRDDQTIGGLLRLAGTTDRPFRVYSGELHQPRLLREARDRRQGHKAVMNSQLRPEVVLALDVSRLGRLSLPEWTSYWMEYLSTSRSKAGKEPREGWLEKRYDLLTEIVGRLDRLGGDAEARVAAPLHVAIAWELVKDHCVLEVDGHDEVDREMCDFAGTLLRKAVELDPGSADEGLRARIDTLSAHV